MADNGIDLQTNVPISTGTPMPVQYRQIKFLDGVTANDVGIWRKRGAFSKGLMQVTCVGSMTGTVGLFLANDEFMPGNGWNVTVSDTSITAGDVLGVNLQIGANSITALYSVIAGDTADSIATNLAAALNAQLAYLQNDMSQQDNAARCQLEAFTIVVAAAVITITWNSDINQPVSLSTSNTGTTETLTVAQYDSGAGFEVPDFTAVTAVGISKYDVPSTWFKVKLSGYSGTGAITAIVHESLP
jgi:hypothetical protein